ncbi:MAG: type II secretion system protein GspK, partial [Phycisphaerales bacterium]|nr:type II secretion system protein GspK [Phycisphaerales bacterium]
VTSSIQVFSHRQSLLGIEVHDRIQARWAARAGIESSIAAMADHTARPVPNNAFALVDNLDYVAKGEAGKATWDIRHHIEGKDWTGPMDEHAKFNINSENNAAFQLVIDEILAFGVMESILDWIDSDDEPRNLGVERDYYLGLETSYEPRNGLLQSIAELELIAGVMPDDVRGEDWDLDFRLDANEDDGGESLPWDEPDKYLEGGWASLLTTSSVEGGGTESGYARLNLARENAQTLQLRLGIEPAQADALLAFGASATSLSTLLTQTLRSISGDAEGVTNLTDDQLRLIFAETCLFHPHEAPPGKLNINTVSPTILYRLFPDNSRLVEELIYLRNNSAGGISSPVDYLEIPGIEPTMIDFIYALFDTRSNVFTISSLGKVEGSSVEQEIIVIVDRSTLPVTILEYREQ